MIKLSELIHESFKRQKKIVCEGAHVDNINLKIKKLEDEWERLDTQGVNQPRQFEISRELQKLNLEKKRWEKLYAAVVTEAVAKKTYIIGGVFHDGRIVATRGDYLNGGHTLNMGRDKWVYDPLNHTVFWWIYPPLEESKEYVVDYLMKNGYIVNSHSNMSKFYAWNVDKYIKENKELVMEGKLEQAAEDFIKTIIKGTEWEGKVFIAGGYVRDEFMGKDPKDLDLLVNAPNGGIEFANWITKKINAHSEGNPVTFPRFGTAKFNLRGVVHNGIDLSEMDIEAVMPRKEQYTAGSRKPEVSGGTLKDDVDRRDFTVNSLLKDLSTGEILDLTGMGRDDIKAGIIRTPLEPDKIFTDDPLRMLRAVRFAVKYNWKLPLFMMRGLKKNAAQLQNISSERIRDELNKMLITMSPEKALKILKITGLMDYVIPEFKETYKLGQNKYHKHDVWMHSLEVLKKTKPELINRLMGMLHDIGKTKTKSVVDGEIHFYSHEHVGAEMAEAILTRLKYPSEIIDAVVNGIKNHMRLKRSGAEGEIITDKALRKFTVDLGNHLEATLDVMQADNLSHEGSHIQPEQIPGIIRRIEKLKNTIPQKGEKLPVTGEDLKAMGLKPGPLFSELIGLVKDLRLENPNATKEEYLDMIKKHLKSKEV